MRRGLSSITLAAVACSSAYVPQPVDLVVACGEHGACPSGMVCTSSLVCWSPPDYGPPPVTGLNGQAMDGAVLLRWDSNPAARQYFVFRRGPGDASFKQIGITSQPTWTDRTATGHLTTWFYGVLAGNVRGMSLPSPLVSVELPLQPLVLMRPEQQLSPVLEASVIDSAAEYDVLFAASAEGNFTTVAHLPGTPTLVHWLGPEQPAGQDGYYAIDEILGNLRLRSNVVHVQARPGPVPFLRGMCRSGLNLVLTWGVASGADAYEVGGTGLAPQTVTGTTVTVQFPWAPDGAEFYVSSTRGGLHGATVTLQLPTRYAAVTNLRFVRKPGAIELDWDPSPGAPAYEITQGSPPGARIGIAESASFLVEGAAPFINHTYWVIPSNFCNSGSNGTGVTASAGGFVDASNDGVAGLTPFPWSSSQPPVQTFTVGRSGVLDGLELSEDSSTGFDAPVVRLYDGDLPLASAQAFLDAVPQAPEALSDPAGRWVLPLHVPVQAGQVLRFAVNSGGMQNLAVSTTPYGGGSLFLEGWRDSRDLVFRTFVSASSALTKPDAPLATVSAAGVKLSWGASPGATSYDVLRDDAVVASVRLPGAQDLDPPAGTHAYRIAANGPSGQMVTDPTTVVTAAPVIDAMNLGDASSGVASAKEFVSQSVTVTREGVLAGFEVAIAFAPNPTHTFDVVVLRSASGEYLNDFVPQWQELPVGAPSPLSASAFGVGYVEMSGAKMHVMPGDRFTFEIYGRDHTRLLLDSADVYPGGTELIDGVAVPGRDLAFKLVLE